MEAERRDLEETTSASVELNDQTYDTDGTITKQEFEEKKAFSCGNLFKSKPWYFWIACVCFIEWALIHIVAGIGVIGPAEDNDVLSVTDAICSEAPDDVKEQAESVQVWSPMVSRILVQHGFNLLFVGFYALIIPFWYSLSTFYDPNIFRYAFYLSLWPYLADWGYFIGIDTVGYGGAFAEAQTYIISIGLLLTAITVRKEFSQRVGKIEFIITIIIPLILILAGIINKILFAGAKEKLGLPQ